MDRPGEEAAPTTMHHLVTFKHPDGTVTQHINVETERLAGVFAEADWGFITEAKVIASGGPVARRQL